MAVALWLIAAAPGCGDESVDLQQEDGVVDAELGEARRPASLENPYGVNHDFGIVGMGTDPAVVRQMRDIGVGWVRYWVSWHVLEPSDGNFQWAWLDAQLQPFFAEGINVYISVIGGPPWAHGNPSANCSTGTDRACSYWPMYCNAGPGVEPPDNPNKLGCRLNNPTPLNTTYFTRFVTALVNRYKDRVKYWGFFNETTGAFHWPSGQWELAAWALKPGYDAVKAADPSAFVVGTEEYNSATLATMLGPIEGAYGRLFDVISFHTYGAPDWSLDEFERTIRDHSSDDPRPVWVGEYNMDCAASTTRRIMRRGWITKSFVYRMQANPVGVGYGLVNGASPCDLGAYQSYIAQNPPPLYISDLSGAGAQEHDFILLQNPNAWATTATLDFSGPNGLVASAAFSLPANGRQTVYVPSYASGSALAALVRNATPHLPIFAEHAAYDFTFNAGRDSEAAMTRSSTWYFAEGATGTGFGWRERFSVFNPTDEYVLARADYMHNGGGGPTASSWIAPHGVWEYESGSVAGLASEHSTRVSAAYSSGSPAPIAAERTISWQNGIETHSTAGAPFPSRTWYFAEGSQSGFFSTFLLLQNPTDQSASVNVRFLMDGSAPQTRAVQMPARSRATVQPPSGDFGMEVVANRPIVAERTIYAQAGWTVGTAGVGAPAPSRRWTLPEGSTEGSNVTFILIANPGTAPARVWLRYHRQSGGPVDQAPFDIAPGRRRSVTASQILGAGVAFSTEVQADQPVVVERALYFNGWQGGHVALGQL